jgi:NADH:ubiquinone oxidoreductase subunit E
LKKPKYVSVAPISSTVERVNQKVYGRVTPEEVKKIVEEYND